MVQKRIINILFDGLKIYSLNIHKFLLYMAFPVLGQVLGLFLIFAPLYWYTKNIGDMMTKFTVLNNPTSIILSALVIIIPGMLIMLTAFWDYIVAYGALNSMTEGYLNTGKVYDFKAHRSIVLNKTFSYIAIWFLFGLFALISVIPIFWIIGFIFFVYFVLIFQVFTFENGLSPFGYFRRSFELIKGHFLRTLILLVVLSVLTYCLIPTGLSVLFDATNITKFFSKYFEIWALTLPIDSLERYGITPINIADMMVEQFAFFIAVGFTLPLRSICWTLWYNELNNNETKTQNVKKVSNKKNKNLKIEKREIDPEIIRRARLEDDEY